MQGSAARKAAFTEPIDVPTRDMSRHDKLIDRSYQETKEFLADHDQEETDVATIPEMTVEVDVREEVTADNRSADRA